MVRERGLEPPRLAALAPHASVYTISPLALSSLLCNESGVKDAHGYSKRGLRTRIFYQAIRHWATNSEKHRQQ